MVHHEEDELTRLVWRQHLVPNYALRKRLLHQVAIRVLRCQRVYMNILVMVGYLLRLRFVKLINTFTCDFKQPCLAQECFNSREFSFSGIRDSVTCSMLTTYIDTREDRLCNSGKYV